jgi:hypothetical protein
MGDEKKKKVSFDFDFAFLRLAWAGMLTNGPFHPSLLLRQASRAFIVPPPFHF